jgi:hypothetical protein
LMTLILIEKMTGPFVSPDNNSCLFPTKTFYLIVSKLPFLRRLPCSIEEKNN